MQTLAKVAILSKDVSAAARQVVPVGRAAALGCGPNSSQNAAIGLLEANVVQRSGIITSLTHWLFAMRQVNESFPYSPLKHN